MDKKTIAVCGATGKQGGAVVESLLNRTQWNVIALSRNPEGIKAKELSARGVNIVKADLLDRASLMIVFKEVYGVFGVTQPFLNNSTKADPMMEIEQGHNIVDSCAEMGVKHLVLSTVFGNDNELTGVPHLDSKLKIVDYLRKSNVPYTVLKPSSFMDNIGSNFFPVRKGKIRGFIDRDVKVPYIATKDIGEFAALVFDNPELYLREELNLVADLVSGDELARTFTKINKYRLYRYKAIPRLPMQLFAKEFYQMRVSFEKAGRPPLPEEYALALKRCREIHPGMMDIEQFLVYKGYSVKKH